MLLAIDTSTRMVGVAIYDGVGVLSESTWRSANYHTVELAPAVDRALGKIGLRVSRLEAVAVAIGPGSFTGLRIGLALAKGLALAHHLPLMGVPSLDVLAEAQPRMGERMAAVLRAGRGRLAVGWYQVENDSWRSTGDAQVLTVQELSDRIHRPTYVCGELFEQEQRLLARKRVNVILASPAQSLRRAGYLAELGYRKWQSGQEDDPATLSPIYLHHNQPIPG
jgi:tRNA threonylcarbamoyladenosine biosynthesis protein TsaB